MCNDQVPIRTYLRTWTLHTRSIDSLALLGATVPVLEPVQCLCAHTYMLYTYMYELLLCFVCTYTYSICMLALVLV